LTAVTTDAPLYDELFGRVADANAEPVDDELPHRSPQAIMQYPTV